MLKRRAKLEWEFLADKDKDKDKPWPSMPQNVEDRAEQDGNLLIRRAILFSLTMAFFLIAGIGGAYARQEALKGVEAIEQEVQAVVEAGEWVQHEAPELSADVLVDDSASSYVQWMVTKEQDLLAAKANGHASKLDAHIHDLFLTGGTAVAEVILTGLAPAHGTPPVYRETRFYRETEQGWLRTQPDPALWGALRTLETDHLIWRYRQRDEAPVIGVAQQIDALYGQLQRDYGLAQSPEEAKQVIDVQVDAVPGIISPLMDTPTEAIVVPSPSMYIVPVEWTDAEILGQSVALILLENMWIRAVEQHRIERSRSLLFGIRLWQLWETRLGLSEWRDDVVRWLYGDVASDADESEAELPARYRELCAAHGIWMMTPATIGVPLRCDSSDSGPYFREVTVPGLRRYSLIGLKETEHFYDIRITQLGKPIQMFTVVDYAVTAYGRERLPDLVAALGRHDRWETLVPAVYGVSLDEFERGWQQHVASLGQ